MHITWVLYVAGWALLTIRQQDAVVAAGSCQGQTSCSSCLTVNPRCAWCRSEDYSHDRCDQVAVVERFCAGDHIVSPQSSFSVEDVPPSDESSQQQPVQITPQNVRLRLRPHEPYEFEVKFRQAEDYPLDLYYLMDLTYSQWDDKQKLEELGDAMATTLRSLTANFRVGFGSFVDKPVMPYVSQVPRDLANPCAIYDRDCVAAYGFRNHLNLTNNVHQFTQQVRAAQVSGNIDDPEGGFDAIVQAVSCSDSIGWNKKSRRLLIYSSNGLFHLAGQGMLGGAAKKNDLECHLDGKGYYTQTGVQDYPSVEELDSLLRKESMNVVFAVTDKYKEHYQQLAKIMKASVQVEELLEDSSNILTVIKKQYEAITSRIELQDDAAADILVRYRSRCLGPRLEQRNTCAGIKTGDQVSFLVQVEPQGCPDRKSQTIYLKDALTSETVRIDLEVLCGCDCEVAPAVDVNSIKCSRVGNFSCGVCACPDNRAGWQCECSEQEGSDSCRPDNATSGPLCSGRGTCVCGQCQCWPSSDTSRQVDGRFCQCDSFSCDRSRDGRICGGAERGSCDCGQCVCRPGWTGDDCSCSNDTRLCAPVAQRDGQVCNGKGDCVCGRCRCYNTEQGRYAGLFCEDCPTCRGLCRTYQPCAQCLLRSGANCLHDCPYVLALKESLGPAEQGTICRFEDDTDGCFYSFQYYSDVDGNAIIDVLRKKECSEVDVLAIVLGTVGAVLAVGVGTLLLWRLYTYLADRREYARFEADLQAARDNNMEATNALYQSPVTTYVVPGRLMATFRGAE